VKRRDKAANAREFFFAFSDEEARKTRILGKPVHVSRISSWQNRSAEHIKGIVSKLSKAGVLVPELVAYSAETKPRFAFESFGKRRGKSTGSRKTPGIRDNTLRVFLSRFCEPEPLSSAYLKQVKKLLSSAARSIATMHGLGIEHGHVHFNNFIPVKSRVGLIDFKMAREKKPNWESAEGTDNVFNRDYAYLRSSFLKLLATASPEKVTQVKRLRTFFFRKLVEKYPMDPKEKKKLLELLIE